VRRMGLRAEARVCALVAGLVLCATLAPAQEARPVDRETFESWVAELSNWGRWGEDDERGTLNLIDPDVRKAAVDLVQEGRSVSLAHAVLTQEAADNPSPFGHRMLETGASDGPWAMDELSVVFHGYAHSHMDAVCHRFYDGKIFNGFSRDDVTAEGCQKLAITTARDGILTRGVLVDLPRLRGVPWIPPGTAIYREDLDAWERETGVKVRPGDALLIRTGRWVHRAAEGPTDVSQSSAGLHASAVSWLRERDVAVLGSEASSDVLPSGVEGETHPVHVLALVALGMPILDNLDLDAIAEEAARLKRWEFLLAVAPLVVPGGTGSPVNPIATF
jgi:kynurenine formamidase